MADIIKMRRDTAANWTTANPILADGELGFEKDTKCYKMGDGVTSWNDLDSSYDDSYIRQMGDIIKELKKGIKNKVDRNTDDIAIIADGGSFDAITDESGNVVAKIGDLGDTKKGKK